MRALAALAVLSSVTVARAATSDDYDHLGRLERVEVDRVLAARGREVDREPAGKTIRDVVVVTLPVFGADEAFLRWLNAFHATTREAAIRRELRFAAGEAWDQERVDETLRGIRDPLYHNVLVILPLVVAGDSARVDALVVVRDVW